MILSEITRNEESPLDCYSQILKDNMYIYNSMDLDKLKQILFLAKSKFMNLLI